MPLTYVEDQRPPQNGALTYIDTGPSVERRNVPRESSGPWEAAVAGYQGSATGLLARGRLPDVVLNREHAPWYDRAIEGIASTASELPEMAAGAFVGGLPGTLAKSPTAAIGGAGAGMMAVPTEIRESLMRAYQNGETDSSADWLTRAGIIIKGLSDPEVQKATAKSAAVGAATLLAGMGAARLVGSAIAPAIGQSIGVGTARAAIGAADTAAQIGTMTVAPAALEGRLPEMQDIADAAIVIVGMKAAGHVSSKIADIYAKTGILPDQVVADAKSDPTIKEDLQSKDTEIPRAYKPLAVADAVKNIVPDPLTDAEHALKLNELMQKPSAEVPADKVPNYINFNYMDTPDNVKGADARISELFEQDFEKISGTSSWESNKADATKIISAWAKETGSTLEIPKDPREFSKLAARVMANKSMTERAAYNIRQASDAISAGGATPENISALGDAMEKARLIKAVRLGNEADIARAMNAMKSIKQVKSLTDQYLEIQDRYGADPVTLANMIGELDTSDKVSRFASEFEEMNNWQKAQQVYRFSLLTGVTVFQVKGIGDLMGLSERILRRYIAAGVSKLPFVGSGDATFGEANAMLSGTWQATRDGVNAMVKTWRAANSLRGPDNSFGFRPTFGIEEGRAPAEGSVADIANKTLALPHRAIAAETEMFRVLNERGEMSRLAHLEAVKDRFVPGTDDYNSRITEILKAPSKEMIDAAKLAGDEGTFTKKLGQLGKLLQGVSKHDQGGFVVPFATVPANLASWAISDLPILGTLTGEAREAWKSGGSARDMVIAKQLIGSTVVTLAVTGVLKGAMTGGSQWMTPAQKQAREDAGIQDYSFKFPWSDTWHSYNRYQPLGTIAQVASDMTEIYMHANADEKADVLKMTAAVFGHAIISQPYFEGLHQLMQALTSTEEGARYFDGFVSSWVPSFLGQTAAAMDPQKRRIDSLMDAIQSKIPVWRERLLPKINTLTGEPILEKRSLALSQSTRESQDPVLQWAAKLNIGAAKAPKSITLQAAGQRDIGKVQLTPEQQNMFSTTSGQIAHTAMASVINSEAWDNFSDMERKQAFEIALKIGREAGNAAALPVDQRIKEAQRIYDEVMQRMAK